MEDFLKKVAFLGLGTAAATREKISKTVEKLIKQGEITASQGKKLAEKLWADAEKTRKEIGRKIDEGIKAGISKAGFVPKKDFELLKQRVELLEKRLASSKLKSTQKKTQKRNIQEARKISRKTHVRSRA